MDLLHRYNEGPSDPVPRTGPRGFSKMNKLLSQHRSGARLYFALSIASLFVACAADCPPRGYEEGEQFRITVLASDIPDSAVLPPGVECSPLAIGDSFIVQAGPWQKPNDIRGCETPRTTAIDGKPPFAQEYFPYCQGGSGTQLGMSCYSRDSSSCEPNLSFATSPIIQPEDQVLEDATLIVDWWNCHGSCRENFTVRLERLGKGSPTEQ